MLKRQLIGRYILIAMGLLALVLLARDFNNRMADLRRLSVEKDHVSLQVTSLVATRDFLQTQVALASEGALIEEEVREAKYSQEGDHPIILIPGEPISEEAVPAVQTLPQPVTRWQLWLALFIDQEMPAAAP
jgi:cell division protein FtsB